MNLKDRTGWFAAGPRMLQALLLLSDGAFRLFAYLSLTADRTTGRLRVTQLELARVLDRSRNSISSYLDELTQHGVCLINSAPNQHQPGVIEIADAFWPYLKEADTKAIPGLPVDSSENDFIEQIRACLLKYSIVRSSFGAADRRLAVELFRDGVSFVQLERAFLLGLSRKYNSSLNSISSSPIYSLAYFTPILDEIAQTVVSDKYWDYLRLRLTDLDGAWLDDRRLRKTTRPPDNHHAASDQLSPDHNVTRTNSKLFGPHPTS
jgi:hypothetical protein